MPLYQRSESGLVARAGETLEQLAISRTVRTCRADGPAEMAKDKMECGGGHAFNLSCKTSLNTYNAVKSTKRRTFLESEKDRCSGS